MIAAFFPETRLVFGEEAHAFYPLRGFPRVKLRNDQTHRAAVFGRNWRAVMQESEERILIQEVFDRNVGGPAVIISLSDDELCFRFHPGELRNLARRHTGPDVIEPRPARDAMKVGIDLDH